MKKTSNPALTIPKVFLNGQQTKHKAKIRKFLEKVETKFYQFESEKDFLGKMQNENKLINWILSKLQTPVLQKTLRK